MNMPLQAHDLHSEFPEHTQSIHDLKMSNQHFSKLFASYDEVNKQIRGVELEAMRAISDDALEDLKKQRLNLKDQLYAMLAASDQK
jgi:uncharacterized protein